jgi:hypothetical protein
LAQLKELFLAQMCQRGAKNNFEAEAAAFCFLERKRHDAAANTSFPRFV